MSCSDNHQELFSKEKKKSSHELNCLPVPQVSKISQNLPRAQACRVFTNLQIRNQHNWHRSVGSLLLAGHATSWPFFRQHVAHRWRIIKSPTGQLPTILEHGQPSAHCLRVFLVIAFIPETTTTPIRQLAHACNRPSWSFCSSISQVSPIVPCRAGILPNDRATQFISRTEEPSKLAARSPMDASQPGSIFSCPEKRQPHRLHQMPE